MSKVSVVIHMVVMVHPFGFLPARPVQGSCSGVYVAPRTVLTAAHCVDDFEKDKLWVKTDTRTYSASVYFINKDKDLALIHTAGLPHKYVKLGESLKKGDKVYTYNNSDDMHGTYGEGYVANIIPDDETHQMQYVTSIGIAPGASGGPVFDKKGRLVGIWTKYLKGASLSFAVETETLRAFLEDGKDFLE